MQGLHAVTTDENAVDETHAATGEKEAVVREGHAVSGIGVQL